MPPAIATVSGAVVAALISSWLYVVHAPMRFGGPRIIDSQWWEIKVTMMILGSWSAIRCLRRSTGRGAMKAVLMTSMWVLVASYLYVKLRFGWKSWCLVPVAGCGW